MKRAQAISISPLLAAVVLWAGCGSDDPTSQSTNPSTPGAGGSAAGAAPAGGAVAGGGTPGAGGVFAGGTAGGSVSGGTVTGTATTAGTGMPGGTPAGGNISTVTVDNKPCEKVVRTAAKTIPDFMIVLDRSQSMKPDCTQSAAPAARLDCGRQNVNCNEAPHMGTTICGGTMPSTLDRWTPAVGAIKSLTQMFESRVSFGLTVFPGPQEGGGGRPDVCATGTQRVPLGLKTAGAIAGELDMTMPTGYTPTGPTLEVVAQQIQAKKNQPDTQLQPQYVLLVTDGAPTCPGMATMNAQAHQATIAAIDKLAMLGVKTYVIGYDASVDPMLAMQLTEYAQHGGTNNFFAVQDGPSLVAQFASITTTAVECTYTLDKKPDDPKYVLVELDGKKLDLGDPNGWSINDRNVTIEGAACAALRDSTASHTLAVTVECKPVVLD